MPTAGMQEHGGTCGARLARERVGPVSLPVLRSQGLLRHPPLRKSRSSRWRAGVLIAVNVLMALHILQWLFASRDGVRSTVSPVEPSESMYTLEAGQLNAGFIFFCAAILSTLVFGRFFCGWGCHVVALQDLCGAFMKKCGVHPRPFRSRFLILGTFILAFYMFAWPTLKRVALFPLLAWMKIPPHPMLGEPSAFPGFSNHLVVEDFWRTFPEWYIAIPFLFVCGFATVYFLGAKGFCYSACPYGGVFGPVDRLSPGRIVVNDDCEQCGHCTAVCTSNVRVHQEVRDFGMVMDSGCMKCMDCVSVCPNHALSFKFASPALFTGPRTPEARAGDARRPAFDLPWPADLGVFAVGVLLFFGFRGMFNAVPLLMAAGLAGVGAAAAWKLVALASQPSVRLQSLTLKLKGRLTSVGWLFCLAALAYLAAGVWGVVVKSHQWRAEAADYQVKTPFERVFSPNYIPTTADAALAGAALYHFEQAGPFSRGGIGWKHTGAEHVRMAWLHAVRGNLPVAEEHLWSAIGTAKPSDDWVDGLIRIRVLRGDKPADLLRLADSILARHPLHPGASLWAARFAAEQGDLSRAKGYVAGVMETMPRATPQQEANAIVTMLQLGGYSDATAMARRAVERRPESGTLRFSLATCHLVEERPEESIRELRNAIEREPKNTVYRGRLVEVLRAMGREAEARSEEAKAGAIGRAR